MGAFNPGELYFADFGVGGRRPIVVVSKDVYNRGKYVLAIPCTSAHFQSRKGLPSCVPFHAGEFGLPKDCVAQCELLTPIEQQGIDQSQGMLGILDEPTFRSLIKAIGHVLDSDCEPN